MQNLLLKNQKTLKVELVNTNDICFVTTEREQTIYHTENEEYRLTRSVDDAQQGLKSLGFERLDRLYVVNMNKIISFNQDRRVVYFSADLNKYACVSHKSKIDLVKNYLMERNLPIFTSAPNLMQILLREKSIRVSTQWIAEITKLIKALNALEINFDTSVQGTFMEIVIAL